MSVKQNGVLITAPLFGTGRETVGEFPGYSCGYCQGNGWFWGTEEGSREDVQVPCPVCEGSGELDAIITVDWKPTNK